MAIPEPYQPLAGITSAGHVLRARSPYLVLISAARTDRTEKQNADRMARLSARLWRAGFRPAMWRGSWEGIEEATLAITCADPGQLALARNLAALYHQQCVLSVGSDGEAWLLSCDDGEPEQLTPIGQWREVSEAEARSHAGWTRDADGRYWVAT